MLHDLSFIGKDKPWPPDDIDERVRLAEHQKNEDLYNDLHLKIFPSYASYMADRADDSKKQIILLGWGEKATSNYCALCLGEDPVIKVNKLPYNSDLPNEEVLIDVSRDGIGLYEITQDGVFAQNPGKCYMVTDPGNFRKVINYVFFAVFTAEKRNYIKFTIHGAGYIRHQVYELVDGKIGERRELSDFSAYAGIINTNEDGDQKTGVSELLIVRVDNALSSERSYGRSDYTPSVVSLLEALEKSFSRREEVLAKFSQPVIMAPEDAYNHFNFGTNTWELRLDEPIMLGPKSTQEAKYLTWAAELGAVEKAIDEKMGQLLQMLDLVKSDELGKAESGTALAFRLIPTTSRVRRFARGLQRAIPKVVSLLSQLQSSLKIAGAVAIVPEDVNVAMKNGLPKDQTQTVNWATMAYAAGGMSLETYVSITQDLEMESEALQAEIERIRAGEPTVEIPVIDSKEGTDDLKNVKAEGEEV